MALLVVHISDGESDLACDWLWSLGATAIEDRSERGELIAGFDDAEEALAVRSLIGERWPTRFEEPPDESEWRDVWLRHLEPVVVGRLIIHPPWRVPDEVAENQIPVSVDPGQAFGSGHHESTQLAIVALGELIQPGDSVLDVGCGTGVLSLAAAAFGARSVLGIDLDLDIVELARSNAEANGLSEDVVQFSTRDVAALTESFDVVIANMTLGTVMPLLDAMSGSTDRDLVLSGLLADQIARLDEVLRAAPQRRWASSEWTAAHYRLDA